MKTFSSGARSSEAAPRYDLVPLASIRRQAARMAAGAASHGARNYLKGVDDAAFVADRKNHLIGHVLAYVAGDTSDDHLGAILANAGMLAEIEAVQDSRKTNDDAYERSMVAGAEELLRLLPESSRLDRAGLESIVRSGRTSADILKHPPTPPKLTYDERRTSHLKPCECGREFTHPERCLTQGRCLALDHPHAK